MSKAQGTVRALKQSILLVFELPIDSSTRWLRIVDVVRRFFVDAFSSLGPLSHHYHRMSLSFLDFDLLARIPCNSRVVSPQVAYPLG